jgi:hypothetical protein
LHSISHHKKDPEKLTNLTELDIRHNPDLTKAQIDELQQVLRSYISSNPKK